MRKCIYFTTIPITSTLMLISSIVFSQTYPIVDPNQSKCYDTMFAIICPSSGLMYYGQDAQYTGNLPSYALSADGKTVHDNITNLTWMRTPNTTNTPPAKPNRMSVATAYSWVTTVNASNYGGFNDWRIPTIKELYSLYSGQGTDPGGSPTVSASVLTPFIDTTYFKFAYGNTSLGERLIDQQYMSNTSFIFNPSESGYQKQFGVNFSDGRIKGYDTVDVLSHLTKTYYVQLVRGTTTYGYNSLVDNGDQTITDNATGLMWTENDNGSGLIWSAALAWVQTKNAANYLGHSDWRLPNIKELQSIVDYSHAPDHDGLPAIDTSFFHCSSITNEAGLSDYPYYWSGTTHEGYDSLSGTNGGEADYIPFGRALGWPTTQTNWVDVHGAGCQRSDPKVGPPYPYAIIKTVVVGGITHIGYSHGPQGDAIRGSNYVRLVRNAFSTSITDESLNMHSFNLYPNPATTKLTINYHENITTILIANLLGQTIYSHEYNSSQVQIDIADLPTGIYLIKINGAEVRKFVKR